jgi:tetratricopeptide (TPR) repeat protein
MVYSDALGTPPPPDGSGATAAANRPDAAMPPSKPLQIFLLCAFILTGLAYLADVRSQSVNKSALEATAAKVRHLVLNQDNYLSHSKYGFQAMDKKHYDLAVYHFRAALITADTPEGHYNLGTALLKQGNSEDAFAHFKSALHSNPKSTAVYKAWGQALMAQGKPDEASRIYQDGLQHAPNDPLLHYSLGTAWEAQHQDAQAVDEYAQAARLGLATLDLWLRLGNLLIEQRKFADADSYLAKAVAIKPDLPDTQFKLALAQQQQGKYGDAIGHYETMLTLTPDHPETLNNMALIYAAATNAQVRSPKMAVMLATRASAGAGDQNSHYLDTLARSYAADGDFPQALVWEDKAIHRAQQLSQQDLLKEFQSRYALFQQQKTE